MAGAMLLATVLSVGAQAASYQSQRSAAKKSERAQELANKTAQASSQVAQARARRQAIAQARMAQASNLAQQGSQVANSSALSGTQAGISSQLGANIGFANAQSRAQQSVFDYRQQASNAMAKGQRQADLFNSIDNISQQAGNAYMTYGL